MAVPKQYWLMKSEPDAYSYDDLMAEGEGTWDGVRNYTAAINLRTMKVGDEAFFYHSNCKVPGIAGLMKIVKEAYVDHTQFDHGIYKILHFKNLALKSL